MSNKYSKNIGLPQDQTAFQSTVQNVGEVQDGQFHMLFVHLRPWIWFLKKIAAVATENKSVVSHRSQQKWMQWQKWKEVTLHNN